MFEESWKKVCSRTKTKSIPLLQPEHGFVDRMDQCVANSRIGIRMKTWWCSPFVWKVDVVLPGARILYYVNKDGGDKSLLYLVFRRHTVNAILKYSNEDRLSLNHVGIWNILSNICYEDTKHYQMQSEHRRTQNPFKHLRWCVFE